MKNKKFMGRVLACVLTGAMALSMAAFAAECTHPIGFLKVDNEDGKTHHFECVTCHETVAEKGDEAHSYNAEGKCACGAKKACTHSTGYLKIDDENCLTHHFECVDCGETIGSEAHSFNKDGKCVCGADAPEIPDEDFDDKMNVDYPEDAVITVTFICDGNIVETVEYTVSGESGDATFTVTAPYGFVFSKNFNNELNVSDAEGGIITSRTVFVHADETLDSDIFVDAGDDAAQPGEYLPIDDNMDASMNVGRSFFSVVWDFLFGWTRFFK